MHMSSHLFDLFYYLSRFRRCHRFIFRHCLFKSILVTFIHAEIYFFTMCDISFQLASYCCQLVQSNLHKFRLVQTVPVFLRAAESLMKIPIAEIVSDLIILNSLNILLFVLTKTYFSVFSSERSLKEIRCD